MSTRRTSRSGTENENPADSFDFFASQAVEPEAAPEEGNPQVPVVEPAPESNPGETLALKSLGLRQIGGRAMMVTLEGSQRAFLVPMDRIVWSATHVSEVDVSQEGVTELPAWTEVINAVLPDRETMLRTMQQSFWLAGAIQESDLSNRRVREQLFSAAYPYELKE